MRWRAQLGINNTSDFCKFIVRATSHDYLFVILVPPKGRFPLRPDNKEWFRKNETTHVIF